MQYAKCQNLYNARITGINPINQELRRDKAYTQISTRPSA